MNSTNYMRKSHWEVFLLEELYTLFNIATNATLHEGLFSYQRWSPNGHFLQKLHR